jgi:uncharacterized membrane protein YbhN (UPF0104 family)
VDGPLSEIIPMDVRVSYQLPAPALPRVSVPRVEDADAPDASFSRRKLLILAAATVLTIASGVVLAGALGDLPDIWERISHGDPRWLALAALFEIGSFVGHIVLFNAVGRDDRGRITLGASAEINLAGHAATRLLATAGAGGIALTAWAMRRAGMPRSEVGARMVTFTVLLYSVYMGALIFGGLGLYTGVLPGGGSAAVTLVPALFGAAVIAIALTAQLVRPAQANASRARRILAPVGSGVRRARRLALSGNPALLGALMWWGLDIAVLWASFKAFGHAPPAGVLVVAYFVGMLANTLPLPGGIGGVDGGMIGALVAFGTNPGLALVAVLAYRVFAFWLPIAPGALAYVKLRGRVAGWALEDAAGEPRAVPAERRRERRPAREPALAHCG